MVKAGKNKVSQGERRFKKKVKHRKTAFAIDTEDTFYEKKE